MASSRLYVAVIEFVHGTELIAKGSTIELDEEKAATLVLAGFVRPISAESAAAGAIRNQDPTGLRNPDPR